MFSYAVFYFDLDVRIIATYSFAVFFTLFYFFSRCPTAHDAALGRLRGFNEYARFSATIRRAQIYEGAGILKDATRVYRHTYKVLFEIRGCLYQTIIYPQRPWRNWGKRMSRICSTRNKNNNNNPFSRNFLYYVDIVASLMHQEEEYGVFGLEIWSVKIKLKRPEYY